MRYVLSSYVLTPIFRVVVDLLLEKPLEGLLLVLLLRKSLKHLLELRCVTCLTSLAIPVLYFFSFIIDQK